MASADTVEGELVDDHADEHADGQRRIHLFGDERQRDRDDRRQKRPYSCRDIHIYFPPVMQDWIFEPAIIYYFIWYSLA